jgi:hypothetical protein
MRRLLGGALAAVAALALTAWFAGSARAIIPPRSVN